MLVTIEWHSIELHVPTYFHYISTNINHVSIPTQTKYSTNQDDGLCLNYGKNYLAFYLGCACAKQGGGSFAYFKKGLVKKVYIDRVIALHL
jgi:hypothetical protein